jgi:prepilin-type N-terminal cleavage/methylation domain-containing protein
MKLFFRYDSPKLTAFTLTEVLVVLIIIGILILLALAPRVCK